MKTASRIAAPAIIGLALVGCASTHLIDSWKDPTVQGPLEFKKILAVAMLGNPTARRIAEDTIVSRLDGMNVVPSYAFFSEKDVSNREQAKAKVRAAGFDGAITMRVVEVAKEVSYVPGSLGPAPYGFYGYCDRAWVGFYDPGYYRADTIVRVETNVYSVQDDRLIWSGLSETYNPGRPSEFIGDVLDEVAVKLRDDGLLPVK